MSYYAVLDTNVFGVPYSAGEEVNVTDWTRAQLTQYLSLGTISTYPGWDPPWIAPELMSSWENYSVSYEDAGYRVLPHGMVELQGLVKSGGLLIANPIFVLPEGYRPPLPHLFAVIAGGGTARLDVWNTGEVFVQTYHTAATNAYVSLASIQFLNH